MSVEALTWALSQAPEVPSHCVATLLGLANHAMSDGTSSYPSHSTLAGYVRKVPRQVQKDLVKLEDLGLIRRGDQRHVGHIPVDRRPVVWDLAVERRVDGGVLEPSVKPVSGRSGIPTRPFVRGGGGAPHHVHRPRSGAANPASGPHCSRHRGWPARNCGPCLSETKAAVE